ncbi:GGDEF domain-containing protein [Aureimonas pseudogalii]|nr:GGDEF domain-containing protein [Aureimonas pseudogalii]
MPTLAAGQIIPPDQAMAAYRTQQRILALWDVGASQIERDNQDSRFAPALEAIRGRYFGTGFSFLSRIVERQSLRVNPALDIRKTAELYAETTAPIAELRDFYVERMIAQAEMRQHESLLAMLATLGLAATMVAAVPALAWIAYRQVLRPLLQIRSQIQAICDREPRPVLGDAGTVPQVRNLVRAVDTLWDREHEREALDVERHRLAERLKMLSETDQLTGLANRRGLDLALSAMSAQADDSLGFILVDVDHFKSINDRFGHSSGDRVLSEVANRLTHVAGSDGMVARYGGEEFAVAVADREIGTLLDLAESIRESIEATPVVVPTVGSIALTVSCGVAVESLPEARWDWLVEQADAALYEAKASGRNRVRATNGILRRWGPAERAEPDRQFPITEDAA